MVSSFRYLGRTLMEVDVKWTVIVRNLRKAQRECSDLLQILGEEGRDVWNSGRFYPAVVQEMLLFRLETWVAKPRMVKNLGGLHHQVVQWIVGQLPKFRAEESWYYPPL